MCNAVSGATVLHYVLVSIMTSSTSLFRQTKTRNSKGQEALNSTLLKYKSISASTPNTEALYHQTYGIPLPEATVNILKPIISALTCKECDINLYTRELYTICMWHSPNEAVYRCCFIQPELCSATCSFRRPYLEKAREALSEVTSLIPDASPCAVHPNNKYPQLSGRMVPYVIDKVDFDVKWGFANIARSYIIFIITTTDGPKICTMSHMSMMILSQHFSENAACVYDSEKNLYKITVRPAVYKDVHKANKNTCMNIYSDGTFRLQGIPADMERVCMSFREALLRMSVSRSWNNFISKLKVMKNQEDQET